MRILTAWIFLMFFGPALATPPLLTSFSETPVLYGISPFYFSRDDEGTTFQKIRKRLPEIRSLGANILWLQPIFPSASPGQGYDVMDFRSISERFGSEADFRDLLRAAHEIGLKVILDIPLNHLPEEHGFVQDVIQNGESSRWRDFFQTERNPTHAYFKHEHLREKGQGHFVHYFWNKFFNLNYENPAVREFSLSVLEYWVKEYGIDGYRLDASWGPQDRWPDFYRTILKRLKAIKPDIFILAEDHAFRSRSDSEVARAQAAYDWDPLDLFFLSKWSFQTGDGHDSTVFNLSNPDEAAEEFVRRLQGQRQGLLTRPLRFLQNNDTPSFLNAHTLDQTKFAAATVLLLPGIPLIYYGQEMGFSYEQWHLPTVGPERELRSYNAELWDFYKALLRFKQSRPIFQRGKWERIRGLAGGVAEYVLEDRGKKEVVEISFRNLELKVNGEPLERLLQLPKSCEPSKRSTRFSAFKRRI